MSKENQQLDKNFWHNFDKLFANTPTKSELAQASTKIAASALLPEENIESFTNNLKKFFEGCNIQINKRQNNKVVVTFEMGKNRFFKKMMKMWKIRAEKDNFYITTTPEEQTTTKMERIDVLIGPKLTKLNKIYSTALHFCKKEHSITLKTHPGATEESLLKTNNELVNIFKVYKVCCKIHNDQHDSLKRKISTFIVVGMTSDEFSNLLGQYFLKCEKNHNIFTNPFYRCDIFYNYIIDLGLNNITSNNLSNLIDIINGNLGNYKASLTQHNNKILITTYCPINCTDYSKMVMGELLEKTAEIFFKAHETQKATSTSTVNSSNVSLNNPL